MKKILIAAVVGLLVAGHVAAQESPWLVRARAVNLQMQNDNSASLTNAGFALAVDNKTIPEVDITYFFNKNLAAELILTVPQSQTVTNQGAYLGTFKHLPPVLTVQYHFTDFAGFKPYVGAGLNYTKISSVSLQGYQLDNHSVGTALQVGVDVPLDQKWSLNLDIKKVNLKTDVYASSGANAGTLKLDPLLVGVGLGYRF